MKNVFEFFYFLVQPDYSISHYYVNTYKNTEEGISWNVYNLGLSIPYSRVLEISTIL